MAKARLTDDVVTNADLVAVSLPMHTATRLAAPVIGRVRRLNPTARICAYGLYAPLNEAWLRSLGVDDVLGGEFEEELTAIATAWWPARWVSRLPVAEGAERASQGGPHGPGTAIACRALKFLVPDRRGLPPLDQYATLQHPDGRRTLVGYTEASRGCRHLCRHCPGRAGVQRAVPRRAAGGRAGRHRQPGGRRRGAHHVRRSRFLQRPDARPAHRGGAARGAPVADLRRHDQGRASAAPSGAAAAAARHGCLFVTSAVESIDDRVLARLDKGHTRRDFIEVVALCREVGVTLVPTFVAFHPWITLDGYCDLLDTIAGLISSSHVAPIQLAIRLLIPEGSRLLELDEVRRLVGPFDPATLTYRWAHPDPRVDRLQQDLSAIVGVKLTADRLSVFDEVSALAYERRAGSRRGREDSPGRRSPAVPYLNEPWYCCAEPNPEQMRLRLTRLQCCRSSRSQARRCASTSTSTLCQCPGLLLLATTTGYQTRAFGEAAERLGVELVFATDRCHVLDDPWRDQAIPIRFHDVPASVDAIVDAARTRPIDGILVVGDRPTVIAAQRRRRVGVARPSAGRGGDRRQQTADARAPSRRGPAGAVVSGTAPGHRRRRRPLARDGLSYPCVIKPLALSGSRGVMRADDPASFREAFARLRALLQSPDVRAEQNDAHDTVLIEGFIEGPRVRDRRAAAPRGAAGARGLRQAGSARRSVLRRDDLRHAVVASRRRAPGDRGRRRARRLGHRPHARPHSRRVPRERSRRVRARGRRAPHRRPVRPGAAVQAAG